MELSDYTMGTVMDVRVAGWIGQQVNSLIADRLRGVERMPFSVRSSRRRPIGMTIWNSYVYGLAAVIDLEVIKGERRSCRRRSIRRRQLGHPGCDALEHESLPDTCDCNTQPHGIWWRN